MKIKKNKKKTTHRRTWWFINFKKNPHDCKGKGRITRSIIKSSTVLWYWRSKAVQHIHTEHTKDKTSKWNANTIWIRSRLSSCMKVFAFPVVLQDKDINSHNLTLLSKKIGCPWEDKSNYHAQNVRQNIIDALIAHVHPIKHLQLT